MSALTLPTPTLIDTLWPETGAGRDLLRKILLLVGGTALLALSARLQIPFWPVPMTMQTFVVLVISMAYGPRLGTATLVAYLLEGAAGLPVFAAGGGVAYFGGPTAGYLFGFVAAAWLVGALAQRGWDRTPPRALLAMALGTMLILFCGVTWLSVYLGSVTQAVDAGLLPFVPAAVFKIALAAVVLPGVWRILRPH